MVVVKDVHNQDNGIVITLGKENPVDLTPVLVQKSKLELLEDRVLALERII